jgi:hypothetical protein
MECWDAEIMEEWDVRHWQSGLMLRLVLTRKLRNGLNPFPNQYSNIPLFHYSIPG